MTTSGCLYVVATPIGNLSDITLRAIEVLKAVSVVVAEDTRRSRALLSHLGISGKPVRCIDAHATPGQIEAIVDLVKEGQSVAVLTDAGTPSVSDPGSQLVRACHQAAVQVTPLPGASAVTTAIAGSGLVDQGFWFVGFLPRKGPKRRALIDRIAACPDAVVLFEAPPRAAQTFTDLAERQPDRLLCVARELTKHFEEFATAPLRQWAAEARELRGELTFVLAPKRDAADQELLGADQSEVLARELLAAGHSARDASVELSALSGLSKREAYQLVLKVQHPVEAD